MDSFPDLPPRPSPKDMASMTRNILGCYSEIAGLSEDDLWRVLAAGPSSLRRAAERGLAAEGITRELVGEDVWEKALDEMSYRLTGMCEAAMLHRLTSPPKETP